MELTGWKPMPDERVLEEYPWQAWGAGWAGVVNGILWLFSETVIPGPEGKVLLAKYLVFTLLFLVAAAGTWNLRKWGRLALMATALVDLALFVYSSRVGHNLDFLNILDGTDRKYSLYLTALVYISGPIGDILILAFLGMAGKEFDGEKRRKQD
jgi:hypothetical protein